MCNALWRFLIDQEAIKQMWELVAKLWQLCVQQPCTWWCLCCNVWLCAAVAILITVLAVIMTVIMEIWIVMLVVPCETLCGTITVLSSIGQQNPPNFMCFDFSKHAPPPPPPPPAPGWEIFAGGPYHGFVGEPLAMTATFANVPAGTTPTVSWDLGDGTKVQGTSVSHIYGDVKQYNITVSIMGNTVVGPGPITSDSTTATIDGRGSSSGPTPIG